MAFFEDIGKKISTTSQSVVHKAKDMVDITGLKGQISDEEKKINKYYQNLGKLYYDLQKDQPLPELKDLVEKISAGHQHITSISETIKNIENAKTCPKCGTPLEEGMAFCVSCGAKIEPEFKNDAAQQNVPQQRFCLNCGNKLMPGAMFCTKCGTKQG